MKRSEMVEILEKAINSGLYQDYQFSTESVSDILQILEKAGMLPPRVRVEEVRKAISPEGEEGTFVSWTYKSIWEDENGQESKLMPTPLTDEELTDIYANDEDLKNENK